MGYFRRSSLRKLTFVCIFAGLISCGGGGGGSSGESGGDDTSASSPTTSSQLSYSLSQSSLTVNTDTNDVGGKTAKIYFTAVNLESRPSNYSAYSLVSWTGVGIGSAQSTMGVSNLTVQATGEITVGFRPGKLLGAGTYTGSITFTLCVAPGSNNFTCPNTLAGPPITIPVTLIVTGDSQSGVSATLLQTSQVVEAQFNASAPSSSIAVFSNESLVPLYATFTHGTGSLVSSVSYDYYNRSLNISYTSPQQLGVGSFTRPVQISLCIDPECVHPVLNSPFSVLINYTVTASEGIHYSIRRVDLSATDIAWSAVRQKLYATVPSWSASHASSLTEIDPQTGAVSRELHLGASHTNIALSDDGSFAYVGSSDQGVVTRIALATMTVDLSIPLGSDATYGAFFAGYLLTVPGLPNSVVISRYANISLGDPWTSAGLCWYDDATPRSSCYGTLNLATHVHPVSWGTNNSTLYAYDENNAKLLTLSASTTGITQSNEISAIGIRPTFYVLNGLLYSDPGYVSNVSTGIRVGSLLTNGGTSVIALDAALGRGYLYLEDASPAGSVCTFATINLQQLTVETKARVGGINCFSLGGIKNIQGRLVRWGTNGLAVNGNNQLIIISGSFVTS